MRGRGKKSMLTEAGEDLLDKCMRKGKARSFTVGKKKAEQFASEADRMRVSGDWSKATAVHLVALYAYCHRVVYGVEADELRSGKTYALAAALASRMVREWFGGDVSNAVPFLRWTWRREREREEWRRKNGRSGGRLGWRVQFGPTGLRAEWKIDVDRRARRAGSSTG